MFAVTALMRDSVTIKRESVARVDGFAVKTWTTAARGSSLPTTAICRIQSDKPEDVVGLGARADRRAWRIYFDSDPEIDVRDRIYFTESQGSTERECIVLEPSFQFDNSSALWRCRVQEWIATVD